MAVARRNGITDFHSGKWRRHLAGIGQVGTGERLPKPSRFLVGRLGREAIRARAAGGPGPITLPQMCKARATPWLAEETRLTLSTGPLRLDSEQTRHPSTGDV
jgi:hypothetical protein